MGLEVYRKNVARVPTYTTHVQYDCKLISISLLIYRCIFLTTTNDQQKFITAKNNKNVPLITDDFLLNVTKIHVFQTVYARYYMYLYSKPRQIL